VSPRALRPCDSLLSVAERRFLNRRMLSWHRLAHASVASLPSHPWERCGLATQAHPPATAGAFGANTIIRKLRKCKRNFRDRTLAEAPAASRRPLRRRAAEELERPGDKLLEVGALDHRVQHARLEEELGALEAYRAASGGWSARSRAGRRSRICAPGSPMLRSPSMAKLPGVVPPVVGSVSTLMKGTPASSIAMSAGRHLGPSAPG